MFGVGQRWKYYRSGCLSSGWAWTALVNTPSKGPCRPDRVAGVGSRFGDMPEAQWGQLTQNFGTSKYVGLWYVNWSRILEIQNTWGFGTSTEAQFWHVKVRGVLVRHLKQNFDNSKYVGFWYVNWSTGPVTNEELAEEKTLLEYQYIFTYYVVVLCEGSFDVINGQ